MVGTVDSNAASVLNGQSGALLSQKRVADDLQTFLKMLTTQLNNQNPLEPLDTNEFTQQLVAFSGVEQQIAVNRNLESLIGLQTLNTQVTALGYIGNEVTYVGDQGYLKNGEMRFRVAAQELPTSMTITIQDEDGRVVRTYEPAPTSEPIDITWDGKDQSGAALPEGIYRIKVEALDKDDRPISTFIGVTATVTGIRSGQNNEILLSIEDLLIDSANVIAVGKINPPAAPQTPTPPAPNNAGGGNEQNT